MIVLDTHIWIWWTTNINRLRASQLSAITENETDQIGVSTISCWEVAKLTERQKLILPVTLEEWFEEALEYAGVTLLDLTPEIAITSSRLPGNFHRDPADQLIVATALFYDCPLVTSDQKIRNYPHVITIY